MFTLTETAFGDAQPGLLALQGFYDMVPVVLFLLGSIILLRELYHKMVKGCYCLLAAGSIMVFSAGFLKALHKVVMGLFRVDYVILDKQFTPTESVGFLLLFLALLGMFTLHNTEHIEEGNKTSAFTLPVLFAGLFFILEETLGENGLPVFNNSWPFLIVMIIGAAGFLLMLVNISVKLKVVPSIILFSAAIIFMVGMGYLSTKHYFEGAWYQITCNVCYQTCFFIGCILLKKHGLSEMKLKKDNK